MIIAILVVLIGGGVALLSMQGKGDGDKVAKNEEKEKSKPKPRPKPRKKVKTTERPDREKDMVKLSSKNRGEFEANVGKWVRLQGKVRMGNEEGVIEFEEPAGMQGQLVRGSSANLTGQIVEVIGWLVSDEKIQVDGIFEITTIDPVDLLPKKDVYDSKDGKQLISLRNTKLTFQGKVKKARLSKDKKSLVMEFEGEGYEFLASATIKKMKKFEVTLETFEELVGKTIKVKGKLTHINPPEKKEDQKEQIVVLFSDKEDYEIVE